MFCVYETEYSEQKQKPFMKVVSPKDGSKVDIKEVINKA